MSDYKEIIRQPETMNWFKAAMGIKITRDCLLEFVKEINQACYDDIRKEIKHQHGVPESIVCNQCVTPNVLPCDPANICCRRKRGKCAFHEIHMPRNCPNKLCNEICKQIVIQHRFRWKQNSLSFQGPTWINTDASKWCSEPWHIFKCFVSKDGYKDANQAECTDFNGIMNIIYNCEYFKTYLQDDLTKQENVCTKARDVGREVRHAPAMSMNSQDTDKAIDTLEALLQSLTHVNHQLKSGTLAITTEDVATTFELLKENLSAKIKETLEKEKDKLVNEMVDAFNEKLSKVLETIQRKEDDVLKTVDGKRDDVLETIDGKKYDVLETIDGKRDDVLETIDGKINDVLETIYDGKRDDVLETIRRQKHEVLNNKDNATMNRTLIEIQTWLIEHYRERCVVPVSMLDPGIDVPLERIYVPPSIHELKRGRKDRHGGGEMDTTSRAEPDVSCYRELLHRDGNPVNTIYIQGNPGCGKTTFSTKLVLDWCKAHSKNGASTLETLTGTATTTGKTSNPTYFSDLDTLRDYTFLFFVSLRDYSGTMCNVSQMVEDAIKSNKLPWDDSVWEHKCIVLTDAADEWYHPEIAFPLPRDSACNCHTSPSMPQYLQRNNISNIITARPWKLANLIMSDTLTRLFEISGVTNYTTLAENVITVLAEKDGISKNDQQCKCIDFIEIIKAQSLGNLITVPAVCVQLVHQFYVGRLVEGSLCSVYMNMLDMHIAKGLQKLQIENFDTEEMCVNEIKQIIGTESTEYLRDNWSLVHSASALAFKTLTDTSKESSLVFAENTITNHMTKTKLDYLLQTGIITKKKSLALSSRKNVPYMFLHKTIQEFLASLYIAMNQSDIENILSTIQSMYCDYKSILDIGQLFIFTCGMCAPAAERISKHITDVITCDLESKISISDRDTSIFFFPTIAALNIIVDGFIEGLANKQSCLQLTISHIYFCTTFKEMNEKYQYALNTLIDMNISNIISILVHSCTEESPHRLQEIISQSRETLSYLWHVNTGQLDLQGLKLKYLCSGYTDISNLDCTFMRACDITFLSRLSEDHILQSMSVTGKNIRSLHLAGATSTGLCAALANLTSLHSLTLFSTGLAVSQLSHLPESIRKVVYRRIRVSAQDVKSMVEWSKSRDACVCCELSNCYISDNETDICHWMKQQDGIYITQCKFEQEYGCRGKIFISWSTILSK
ncbi:uncharacterized protein LOC127847196 isoform X2 [Dreissena polymorpha]|uniref:uncharacterized protein LOC127847196 isoform X2 n=1 Tax=Dreissena polymorpha TaxID=45954 RepID=UPI0022653A84|nr:uncharacterized protein LOC127847196 isoform X2 [Dreissena polymorpha]